LGRPLNVSFASAHKGAFGRRIGYGVTTRNSFLLIIPFHV
jgi:hypothetical protein